MCKIGREQCAKRFVYSVNSQRLEANSIKQQMNMAKAELGKPFPQEAELKVKSARLAELDSELNMDRQSGNEQKKEEPER